MRPAFGILRGVFMRLALARFLSCCASLSPGQSLLRGSKRTAASIPLILAALGGDVLPAILTSIDGGRR